MTPQPPDAPPLRLLPAPRRAYTALAADLGRLGWQWAREAQTPPLLPGEPEWVEYRHSAGATLRYDFNPAIGLRELEARGAPAQLEALMTLPRLAPGDVRALLGAEAVADLLLGLFAARALRLLALLPRIHELGHHADELVRRAAEDVARTLPAMAVGEGWQHFQAAKAARPGHSILLGAMDVADRRQVLRWLGRDRRDANEPVVAALRTGLDDDDDEVRVTAALVAARLGAAALAETVRALPMPEGFAAARALALAALAGGRRLAAPEPVDDASLLVHALLEPLPVVPPAPQLPRHLARDGGVVRLRQSGLEVVLVPSLPHWLGGAPGGAALRSVRTRPFALAASPLDQRAAQALGLSPLSPGPLRLELHEARRWIERLGALEGVALRLPAAEEWEMALRGPDGRRFAAGNAAAAPGLSPWGALASDEPEWLDAAGAGAVRASSSPVVELAGPATAPPAPGARHALRFALAFPI